MSEEKSLTTREETRPVIPDEHIDSVIDLSDDIAIWCKLVRGGFQFANQDKIVPELVGKIVSVLPYLIDFDAGIASGAIGALGLTGESTGAPTSASVDALKSLRDKGLMVGVNNSVE